MSDRAWYFKVGDWPDDYVLCVKCVPAWSDKCISGFRHFNGAPLTCRKCGASLPSLYGRGAV